MPRRGMETQYHIDRSRTDKIFLAGICNGPKSTKVSVACIHLSVPDWTPPSKFSRIHLKCSRIFTSKSTSKLFSAEMCCEHYFDKFQAFRFPRILIYRRMMTSCKMNGLVRTKKASPSCGSVLRQSSRRCNRKGLGEKSAGGSAEHKREPGRIRSNEYNRGSQFSTRGMTPVPPSALGFIQESLTSQDLLSSL